MYDPILKTVIYFHTQTQMENLLGVFGKVFPDFCYSINARSLRQARKGANIKVIITRSSSNQETDTFTLTEEDKQKLKERQQEFKYKVA